MKLFLYPQKQKLIEFLQEFKNLHCLYRQSDFSFPSKLLSQSEAIRAFFESISNNATVSRIQISETELYTAMAGIHPNSLEKLGKNRRTIQRGFSFQVLQSIESIVLEEYEQLEDKLASSEDLVGQIVLSALQQGVISTESLLKKASCALAKDVWQTVNAIPQLKLLNQKLSMQLSVLDITLIYEQVLVKLKLMENNLQEQNSEASEMLQE